MEGGVTQTQEGVKRRGRGAERVEPRHVPRGQRTLRRVQVVHRHVERQHGHEGKVGLARRQRPPHRVHELRGVPPYAHEHVRGSAAENREQR
jgi:hypothetical protein